MRGAGLFRARLQGAKLSGADLSQADCTGALYDGQTQWPYGFDPKKRGARLLGEAPRKDERTDEPGVRTALQRNLRWGIQGSLNESDLHRADLRNAVFIQAGLNRANLRQADLRGGNFGQAHLNGADLSQTDLRGADLGQAHLNGANLSRAVAGRMQAR